MEVHHHAHKRLKKWNEYLFEFLMLFLAITASFIVENKREHYIEHTRANQFSKQLLADLRADSLLFENINSNIESMQQGFDSLAFLLTEKTGATDKEVLEVLLPVTYAFDIPATSTTYNQMKSSGALRYIENADLTAHLQRYYDVLLTRSTRIAEVSVNYFSENINPFYLRHLRIQDYDPFNDTLVTAHPVIMERSKKTDQQLANIMGGYRSLLKIQMVSMNNPAREEIKKTMALLKEKYDLN